MIGRREIPPCEYDMSAHFCKCSTLGRLTVEVGIRALPSRVQVVCH